MGGHSSRDGRGKNPRGVTARLVVNLWRESCRMLRMHPCDRASRRTACLRLAEPFCLQLTDLRKQLLQRFGRLNFLISRQGGKRGRSSVAVLKRPTRRLPDPHMTRSTDSELSPHDAHTPLRFPVEYASIGAPSLSSRSPAVRQPPPLHLHSPGQHRIHDASLRYKRGSFIVTTQPAFISWITSSYQRFNIGRCDHPFRMRIIPFAPFTKLIPG
jgi:hypothetical protein